MSIKIISSVAAVALLISALAIAAIDESSDGTGTIRTNDSSLASAAAYTDRATIYIYSDTDFTTPNGVVGGTGTLADPYIISGWRINSTSSGLGIRVMYTNAYFTIENCLVNGDASVPGMGNGIEFDHVGNGTVSNTIVDQVKNDSNGILISYSFNCTINTSHISFTKEGIQVKESKGIIVQDNIVRKTADIGLYIYQNSYNNTFQGNTVHSNSNGIVLSDNCMNNRFLYNEVSGNINSGISLSMGSDRNEFLLNNITNHAGFGLVIMGGAKYNRIHHNNFISNNVGGKQAQDSGGNNFWNTSSEGNHWSDWTTPDVKAPIGIVDDPYPLAGGSADQFPLVSEVKIPEPVALIPVLTICALIVTFLCARTFRRRED